MTAQEKELMRNALLLALDKNRTRFGMGIAALRLGLSSKYGITADEPAIQEQIEYLTDKGLVDEVLRDINRENRTWRITPSGIAYVDEHSLSSI